MCFTWKFKSKRKLVCLTAYSKPISKILDKYCDIILVGDSVATAMYGMKNTKEINLETMLNHAQSVKKSVKKSLLVFDMPNGTYRNAKEAKQNVKKVLKNVKFDAVKIESNGKNYKIVETLVKSGIPVMGHLGLTPQSIYKFGTYTVRAQEKIEAEKLISDSLL